MGLTKADGLFRVCKTVSLHQRGDATSAAHPCCYRGRILYNCRRVSPAKFISSWPTCWHWVRDVGVGFEALALDENRQPSSYPRVRCVDIGFDMLTLCLSSDMLALGSRRWVSRCRGCFETFRWFQDVGADSRRPH